MPYQIKEYRAYTDTQQLYIDIHLPDISPRHLHTCEVCDECSDDEKIREQDTVERVYPYPLFV